MLIIGVGSNGKLDSLATGVMPVEPDATAAAETDTNFTNWHEIL